MSPDEASQLLDRLIKSEELKRAVILRALLDHLFQNGIEKSIPAKTLIREVPGLDRPKVETEEALKNLRVYIRRLRLALMEYFDAHQEERYRVEIPKGEYRLLFVENKLSVDQSQFLNQFWLPFLLPQRPVRLVVDPAFPYSDCGTKGSWGGASPTGLFNAVFTINEFLRLKKLAFRDSRLIEVLKGEFAPDNRDLKDKVDGSLPGNVNRHFRKPLPSIELDDSLSPAPPSGSVLIFGLPQIELPPLKRVHTAMCVPEGFGSQIERGAFIDHYREISGKHFFYCYCRLDRHPLSPKGYVALKFVAYHSIAIEAVVKFLVSSSKVKPLVKLLKPESRRSTFSLLVDIRPELIPVLEEFALLFRVTCQVLEDLALDLRPGIPSCFLKVISTDLIRLAKPLRERLVRYDPTIDGDGEASLI